MLKKQARTAMYILKRHWNGNTWDASTGAHVHAGYLQGDYLLREEKVIKPQHCQQLTANL